LNGWKILVAIASLNVGFFYWLYRTFVTEKTCKAREDCLEQKIDSLRELVETKFSFFETLIKKLINSNNNAADK